MSVYGIDVSKWQGLIDWNKVKASGKDFAIIKAGGSDAGLYRDHYFETNYKNAKAAGVAVGAYYFVGSLFLTKADGEADALRFIDQLRGKKLEYPVYVDVEAPAAGQKAKVTEATIAFCEVMENYGYYVGIYGSDISGFKERMDLEKLTAYDKWVASYGRAPSYVPNTFGMWQYSCTGSVAGIQGDVDLDVAYYNFPAIMKANHLNGF